MLAPEDGGAGAGVKPKGSFLEWEQILSSCQEMGAYLQVDGPKINVLHINWIILLDN